MSAPTPWHVAPDNDDSGHLAVYDAEGSKLALVFEQVTPPGSGSDAARLASDSRAAAERVASLLAVAPDLLACLLDVLDADGDLDVMDFDRYRAAVAAARVQP